MFDIMRKAKSFIGNKKEHVHACFCVSDASGTYSKFAGTAICSLFENTAAPVTVHLLTDETLAEDNRKRFIDLAARYGQEIIFYDVPEQIKETWQEAEDADIIVHLDIAELWREEINA
jgi:lipopolysaccharide biosynthesis glycosyltransferase